MPVGGRMKTNKKSHKEFGYHITGFLGNTILSEAFCGQDGKIKTETKWKKVTCKKCLSLWRKYD